MNISHKFMCASIVNTKLVWVKLEQSLPTIKPSKQKLARKQVF